MKCLPSELLMEMARERPLKAERRARADDHLKACKSCADRFDREVSLTGILQTYAEEMKQNIPPTNLWKRIESKAAVAKSERKQRSRYTAARWMIAATLALAVFGASLLIPLKMPESKQANDPENVPEEAVTPFIPVVHGDIPVDSVQVIRVELPRSTLLEFGYPVSESRLDEPVAADLIVTQDGLPQAIRFVNLQQ